MEPLNINQPLPRPAWGTRFYSPSPNTLRPERRDEGEENNPAQSSEREARSEGGYSATEEFRQNTRRSGRQELYLLAKKSHRWLVLVMVFITLVMAGTGTFLKYPRWAILLKLDLGWIRYLHNQLSPVFTFILALMILSGLVMYWYPWHTRRAAKLNRQ